MSAMDRWYGLNEKGELIEHVENDGWDYVRHGSQAVESPATLDEVMNRYGRNDPRFKVVVREILKHYGLTSV